MPPSAHPSHAVPPGPQPSRDAVRWDGHMCDDVGATSGVTPLAFLSATRDELLLCGNRGTFRIPRESVLKVGRGKMYPWLFRAVRIHHRVPGFPRDLQFKPMTAGVSEVLAGLELLGYPVG